MTGKRTVAMIAPRGRTCGIGDYADLLAGALEPYVHISWVDLPVEPGARAWRAAAAAANEADLAHIHFEPSLFCFPSPRRNRFATLMKRLRPPKLVTLHGPIPDLRSPGAAGGPAAVVAALREAVVGPLRTPWVRRQYHRASEWLVHAPDLGASIEGLVSPGRVIYHPHPIPAVTRTWSATEPHEFDLASPGFVKAHKGYLDLLPLVQDAGWRWRVVGGPQDIYDRRFMDDFARSLHDHGLEAQVSVTGVLPRAHVEQATVEAKAAIFPFVTATGSGSLTWAIGLGMPVLATDLPSITHLHEMGAGIALLPRAEPDRWPAIIASVLRSPEEQTRLSDRNLAFAARHGYAPLAAELSAVYERRLGAGGPA